VKNRTPPPEIQTDKVLARALRLIQSEILPGKSDREGVRVLARICFPASDIAEPGYFTWQYDQNPSGPAYELITKKGSFVTGHCAAIPMRHKIGPDICKGSLGVNVMTHPEYRGRGIYVILQREVDSLCGKDHIQFNFGFSNEYSQRNCLRRLGYQEIGRFPLWMLPFDLNRIVASRTPKQGALMRAAAFAANPFWGLARSMFSLRRKDRSMEIEAATEIPEDFDEFWQKVQADHTNILVRDRAYLEWRFIRHPTRTYKVFIARSKGELRGYLVARMTKIEGIPCGVLVDILAEKTPEGKKAAGRLIAAFNRQARADGAAMGLCLMLRHSPVARTLRRHGYVICPKPFLPREFPIILHWNMPSSPPAGLYDLKRWHMTLGDYDAI
jgi:GNAT superfamily N-acetyltransferase